MHQDLAYTPKAPEMGRLKVDLQGEASRKQLYKLVLEMHRAEMRISKSFKARISLSHDTKPGFDQQKHLKTGGGTIARPPSWCLPGKRRPSAACGNSRLAKPSNDGTWPFCKPF